MTQGEGQKSSRAELALAGLAGSPGVALGRATVLDVARSGVPHRHIAAGDAGTELERFGAGVGKAATELQELSSKARVTATKIEITVLDAYTLMVEDELLFAEVKKRIESELVCAEWALELAVNQ